MQSFVPCPWQRSGELCTILWHPWGATGEFSLATWLGRAVKGASYFSLSPAIVPRSKAVHSQRRAVWEAAPPAGFEPCALSRSGEKAGQLAGSMSDSGCLAMMAKASPMIGSFLLAAGTSKLPKL